MNQLPPDTRADRQLTIVGLLTFVIGTAGLLFLLGWLMWRFSEPKTPWYDILHLGVNGTMISVVGGLALAAGAMWLLRRWHYRRGVYRCIYCGQPLKGIGIPCCCPGSSGLEGEQQMSKHGH